jgi:lipid II:glycine glycyltransferase (peptidoglycan interpeptide bridge formation enzyme)
VSLPFCEYGGPIILSTERNNSKNNPDIDLQKLFTEIKSYLNKDIKEFELKVHPLFGSSSSNAISRINTYIIEEMQTKGLEKIRKDLRKTTRQAIEYAKKEGLEVMKGTDSDLPDFYSLYLKTMKRNCALAMPVDYIRALVSSHNAYFSVCKYQQKIISGIIVLIEKDYAHYFIAANDSNYTKLHSNQALLWEAIQILLSKGVNQFDFGAAREGSSQEVFKQGWGTKQYNLIHLSNNEASEVNSNLRKVWGVLPRFVIGKLSRRLLLRLFQ